LESLSPAEACCVPADTYASCAYLFGYQDQGSEAEKGVSSLLPNNSLYLFLFIYL
jgi:hypothetical protein